MVCKFSFRWTATNIDYVCIYANAVVYHSILIMHNNKTEFSIIQPKSQQNLSLCDGAVLHLKCCTCSWDSEGVHCKQTKQTIQLSVGENQTATFAQKIDAGVCTSDSMMYTMHHSQQVSRGKVGHRLAVFASQVLSARSAFDYTLRLLHTYTYCILPHKQKHSYTLNPKQLFISTLKCINVST